MIIGSLRGRILDRDPSKGLLLLEVAGVGYRVAVPAGSFGTLDASGERETFLWIHHHIRDDAQALYGFVDAAGRDCFETLIATHGIGPAMALGILSTFSPLELSRAVAADDVAALKAIPGVGAKTAARLLVELRNKLDLTDTTPAATSGSALTPQVNTALADVRAALSELGFGPDQVRAAVADLDPDGPPETLLRQALQAAGGRP